MSLPISCVALMFSLLAVAPAAVAQQDYLKASNTGSGDLFGQAVAASGDTLVIGAWGEGSNATGVNGDQDDNTQGTSGAAYVFVRSGTSWIQQAYLKASNTDSADNFGRSVAVSGDTIVVGAWSEESLGTGVNGVQSDNDGSFAGAAYVFVRSGTTWSQQAYLKASNTDQSDQFGWSVAVSGDTIVVGAQGEGSPATGVNGTQGNGTGVYGAAYVFVRSGTTWSQQAYLKASNTDAADMFGSSVTMSGDTLVVGASREDSNATGVDGDESNNTGFDSGAAYVFVRSGTTWSQQAYLKASNTSSSFAYEFGRSVAMSGDTVLVGAAGEGNASGAAYVFARSGTTWSPQTRLEASNPSTNDSFGGSVAVSGDTIVVGAINEDSIATGVNGDQSNNSASQSGAAYLFVRSGTAWSQAAYLKASNTAAGDQFGVSVAVSGDTIVVGAEREASAATGVNGDQDNDFAFWSGAAYVFTVSEIATDLGGGTPGIAGVPALDITGTLVGGTPATMTLDNAPPSAAMLAWISFAPTPFSALSGTVHAFPFASQLFVFSDLAGSFSASTTWPVGVPPGTNVWFQFIVQDASSVFDLTLSNGLLLTTP